MTIVEDSAQGFCAVIRGVQNSWAEGHENLLVIHPSSLESQNAGYQCAWTFQYELVH